MSEAVDVWKVVAGSTQLGSNYTDRNEAVREADNYNTKAKSLTASDGKFRSYAYVVPDTVFRS